MGDYKSTEVAGSSYKRGKKVVFYNSLDSTPAIQIEEEMIYNLNDQRISQDAGLLSKEVSDFTQSFELRNPLDGELTGGTALYSDVYVLLYSLYWHLALERDAVQ